MVKREGNNPLYPPFLRGKCIERAEVV